MAEEPSFDDLMARLRAGDQDAAARLFRRFAQRLIGLARGHLDRRLQAKVDPEDIVQSAFKSFFPRVADGQFELENWESLWSLLVVITLRKCGRKVDMFHGAHRDIRKEVAPAAAGDDSSAVWEAVGHEPTPSEAAILAETVEQVMRDLKDNERTILELRLQGYTAPEIGQQIGRSEYTVNWVLKRLRKRLRHLQGDEAAAGRVST
jgi:RNA polymerase sigma-70 factor (ECF subfamily)